MEHLLSSPEQEAQTSAIPLFWTPPLLCDEVATRDATLFALFHEIPCNLSWRFPLYGGAPMASP
jgi:hypothetical protein